MSLAGLRDISVIETPPEGRRPVQHLRRRVRRGAREAGDRARAGARRPGLLPAQPRRDDRRDRRARPGARARARACRWPTGRWTRAQLEEVMLEFLRGDADVLVCTTIVESGPRHPERQHADRRARRRARPGPALPDPRAASAARASAPTPTCSTPRRAALTEEAQQRLSTLSDYTELGSGFKIAMRDLEIRGAGNLLGDEQSGHVAAVGFELYVAMLDEAVRAARRRLRATRRPSRCGSTCRSTPTCRATTCPTRRPRSRSTGAWPARARWRQLIMLREELEDRFGPIPEPLDNLITLQDARIKLGRAGARTVGLPRAGACRVSPIELDSRGREGAARGAAGARSTSPAAAPCGCACPTTPRRASRRS